MSLILEALRKSEAERRRAQVPDLLTEPQAAAPMPARATPRWPLWVGGAVVVAAAAWFALSRDAATPSNDVASVASAARIEATAAPARGERNDPPPPAPARPAPALQRPLVVAPPAPALPAASAPSDTPPVAATPARDATPQRVASTPAALPVPSPRAEPIASPPARAASPAPAMVASPPAVERIADLGNADRKQLPPLKLSMHMWNDVAAQRVVIIDGTRLGVGDRLGAVVVADIVPDGVLLDWNGRALKLPLR